MSAAALRLHGSAPLRLHGAEPRATSGSDCTRNNCFHRWFEFKCVTASSVKSLWVAEDMLPDGHTGGRSLLRHFFHCVQRWVFVCGLWLCGTRRRATRYTQKMSLSFEIRFRGAVAKSRPCFHTVLGLDSVPASAPPRKRQPLPAALARERPNLPKAGMQHHRQLVMADRRRRVDWRVQRVPRRVQAARRGRERVPEPGRDGSA